jgi:hypothetical protein
MAIGAKACISNTPTAKSLNTLAQSRARYMRTIRALLWIGNRYYAAVVTAEAKFMQVFAS